MGKIAKNQRETDRKAEILEAALHCFLQFGYSKTSMDDIAKEANLSRPLLYLKFKNKEDLYEGIFDHILEGAYSEADLVMEKNFPPREKLFRICEILLVEPWTKISGYPKTAEFYETCSKLSPKSTEKYERQIQKYAHSILGDKDAAEVFFLAMEGMSADLPNAKTLRKRVSVLVNRFVR